MPKELMNIADYHQKMIDYLNEVEPEFMAWLTFFWADQADAMTNKRIRKMILSGDVPRELMEQWQQDYSRLASAKIEPAYGLAMKKATGFITEKYPKFIFHHDWWGIEKWIAENSGNLAVELSFNQHQALKMVISRFVVSGNPGQTVDQLSRAIRPIIGLHSRYATATVNYYNTLIANGVRPSRALRLQTNYAKRLHRYRAMMITRTELAKAYCAGAELGIQQAQETGFIGEIERIWDTSEDERVCPLCNERHGKPITKDQIPPGHPGCRCATIYKEVEG